MGSLSWTSSTFRFLDSRDLHGVLRNFLGREREGGSSLLGGLVVLVVLIVLVMLVLLVVLLVLIVLIVLVAA